MKRNLIAVVFFSVLNYLAAAQSYEARNFTLPERKSVAALSEVEKKEAVVLIEDNRAFEYAFNSKEELEVFYSRHVRIQINEQSMVEAYNKIYIPVNTPDDLVTLHARTLLKDGKTYDLYKGDMKMVTEDDQNYMILAIEGLEKGAELEYFYVTRGDLRVFLTERLQGHGYTRAVRLDIITPEHLIFEAKAYNGKASLSDSTAGSKRWVTVSAGPLTPLDDEEKYTFYRANVMRVEVKLAKNKLAGGNRLYTWDDAGTRFHEALHAFDKSDAKEVSKLISKNDFKSGSQEEQVKKIERFMKSNVVVRENAEEENIKLMLSRKYGSTTQVIKTYIALLESLEIPYELVVSCDRSGGRFDPDFDTWNYLDDYFLYFPFSGKFLDPTNLIYRYGFIPPLYFDNHGLFLKNVRIGEATGVSASLKKIEPTTAKQHFDNMTASISLNIKEEKAVIDVNREMAGFADNNLRAIYFYSNEEDRRKIGEEFLRSCGGEGAEVKNIKSGNFNMNSEEMNQPFQLQATIESSSIIEKAGDSYIISIGQVIGQQVEMYQDHARQNPIDLDFPHSYKRVLKLKVPDGYTAKGLDKLKMNIVADDKKQMGFLSDYILDGNEITVTVDEYYEVTSLPASAYEPFRNVINAAADFNKIKLVLEKNL
jgi:hypothetical protein